MSTVTTPEATAPAAIPLTSPELFALTDEQIIGLTADLSAEEASNATLPITTSQAQQSPTENAQQLSAATANEVAEFKTLYPGGITEAKSAADAARQLAEIDSAFF